MSASSHLRGIDSEGNQGFLDVKTATAVYNEVVYVHFDFCKCMPIYNPLQGVDTRRANS